MTRYWNMTTPADSGPDPQHVDLWIFGDIVDPEKEAVDKWFGLDTGETSARSIEEAISELPENVSLWAQFYNSQDLKEDPQTLRSSLLLAFPEYELRYNNALSLDDQNDFYVK